MKVTLISTTQPVAGTAAGTAEDLIVYCARVSNPKNQGNIETGPRLIRYLIDHHHWSPFELASMCVEIETSRAIAQQILRHRSFSFQEFSQRYADVSALGDDLFEPVEIRVKNPGGNRQGSIVPDSAPIVKDWCPWPGEDVEAGYAVQGVIQVAERGYKKLLEAGVAPESARFVLPLCTRTRLYMTGTVRSWIHYLQIRCDPHTQKEHRLVAEEIKRIFCETFPITTEALGWKEATK